MIINANMNIDTRVREHIFPTKIVWKNENNELQKNCESVLNSGSNNASLASPKGCILKAGGGFCLDYGKEIHGGIRIITGLNTLPVSKIRVRFGESVSETMHEPNNDHAINDTVLDLSLIHI